MVHLRQAGAGVVDEGKEFVAGDVVAAGGDQERLKFALLIALPDLIHQFRDTVGVVRLRRADGQAEQFARHRTVSLIVQRRAGHGDVGDDVAVVRVQAINQVRAGRVIEPRIALREEVERPFGGRGFEQRKQGRSRRTALGNRHGIVSTHRLPRGVDLVQKILFLADFLFDGRE